MTYVPRTVRQIELIVQVAKKFNLSVRCSGFSKSPMTLRVVNTVKVIRLVDNTH